MVCGNVPALIRAEISVMVSTKELYRNGGLTILCYVPHEICWGIFSPASWSSVVLLAGLVTERSARSLRIADRQAWPIRPKFGLDTEGKSSPPFLYSSLFTKIKNVNLVCDWSAVSAIFNRILSIIFC